MRRVLIVCYYFPPTPSAGSVRMRGLVRYLPHWGWQATVVTPRREGRDLERWPVIESDDADMAAALKRRLGLRTDAALKDLIGGTARAPASGWRLRARMIDAVKGVIAVPDTNRGWIPLAVATARGALDAVPHDVLITSSPPPSAHVVGRRLVEDLDLPWVADLRDLWSDDRFSTAPAWRKALDRHLERRTFSHAAALVTVSEPLARDLSAFHPGHRVDTIVNGFDPELVNPGEELTPELTITHTGTLHQGRRDPTMLLEAVRDLVAAGEVDRDRIRIRLYCRHEPWLDALVADHHLGDVVELPSWTDQDAVVRAQRQSQLLLLLHWGGVREEGVYTAKVFEYLAARRPILLIGGSRGVLARLLEETGAGVHVHRPDHLREVLRGLWRDYRSSGAVAWRGRPEAVERYSQVRMAGDFATLLDDVSRRSSP